MTEAASPAPEMIPAADVSKMFAEMKADFAKQLEAMAAAVPVSSPMDVSVLAPIFEKFSMTIAELTDQNAPVATKRLPPAEIQARNAAFEKMGELISEVQKKKSSEWPVYNLVAPSQLVSKDTGPRIVPALIKVGDDWVQTRIRHAQMPNLAMRPDKTVPNNPAEAIYREYVRYLGGSASANRVAPASPAWMSEGGTVIMAVGRGASANARAHGKEFVPEPITIDGEDLAGEIARRNAEFTEEMITPNDPRRREINILGTLAAPAITGMTSARTV